MNAARFGIVGLGTMGRNLALNVESRGVPVAVWDLDPGRVSAFVAAHPGLRITGASSLEALAAAIEPPRRILLMIPAGAPVDSAIDALRPVLGAGDVLIDGGNSWYQDTERREVALRGSGILFVGCGVSGGEEGARLGPSLMPGGPAAAWEAIRDVLEAIAARSEAGPCVAHVGPGGAGHFVKMVHNGIEYADLQLLAESWDVMRRGLGLDTAATAGVFERWNRGPLESFLVELAARVCRVSDPDTGRPLVDMVLDRAGQKGTGRWTAQAALDLGVAVPAIAAAIDARVISSLKAERVEAERRFGTRDAAQGFAAIDRAIVLGDLHDALYAARTCAYAQGMALIDAASAHHGWSVDLAEVGRIWTAGCIIRARLLDDVRRAFQATPRPLNLLLDPAVGRALQGAEAGWRRTAARAAAAGIPVPCHGAALAYFDAYRSGRLPQNLTQAQRDAFGAHTYERVDRPGAAHSAWTPG